MPIRPRREIRFMPVKIRVPEDVHQRVLAYAKFLGGSTDDSYVYTEAARQIIARDRKFGAGDRPDKA